MACNKHTKRCSASSVIREMQRQDYNEISFHVYQIEERKKWRTLARVKEDVDQWKLSSMSGQDNGV